MATKRGIRQKLVQKTKAPIIFTFKYPIDNMIQFFRSCKFLAQNWVQNGPSPGIKQISTAGFPLQIMTSPSLWAEPRKPKKKIDPNVLRLRETRKKKKIEKQIKRLQKFEKQLKPLVEMEIPVSLVENAAERKRIVEVCEKTAEERILLIKEWTKVKNKESKSNIQLLDRLLFAQKQALDELRLESKKLYDAALQIDQNLIPFKYHGPAETPAIKTYVSPDGDYIDVSKKWE